MTRKKWNRLRRQRPDLFQPFKETSWEAMIAAKAVKRIKRYSVRQVLELLTAVNITRKLEQ